MHPLSPAVIVSPDSPIREVLAILHEHRFAFVEQDEQLVGFIVPSDMNKQAAKGGIKPHNRFSVQSKRSEVLFVDYMAEHLTPSGRAGIIVPEGVIFQSQGAYTQLRKMLVEDYLVAVVSLPAGVFNPYSGVKTSILILDKSLAKSASTIAFFKITNDGFGLGAQRRPIDKDDLPQARAEIAEYLRCLRSHESLDDFQPTLGQVVFKEKIAANGDYNLSGERYREGVVTASTWPFVPVGEVFRKSGQTVMPESLPGPVTYIGLENITQGTGGITGSVISDKPSDIKSLKNVFKPCDILYGKLRPNLNKVWLADRKGICSTDIFVIESSDGGAQPALYAYLFRSRRFSDAIVGQLKGAQLPRIGWSSFADLQIPLPPLEVQKEIVAEIEGYQKVIDGARAVLDNYRPHIPIHPDWPMVEIGGLCVVERGASPRPIHAFVTDAPDGVNWIKIGDAEVGGKYITKTEERITPEGAAKSRRVQPGDFILSNSMSFGRPYIMAINGCIHDGWLLLRDTSDALDRDYLYNILGSNVVLQQFQRAATGGVVNNLNSELVRRVSIPLPSLAIQKQIVAEIEAEDALVSANRQLIARFGRKIETVLRRLWGEDLPGLGSDAALVASEHIPLGVDL